MDDHRFDAIARGLGGATSRRDMLKFLFGGTVGLTLSQATGRDAAAAVDKVILCHQGDLGRETISVSASAVNKHIAHGDSFGPCPEINFCTPEELLDPTGGGIPCSSIDDCPCGACGSICFCVNPGFPCVQGPPGSEDRQCCSGIC
jgi:hypothetical protein